MRNIVKNLDKIIVVGDKILIRPDDEMNKTPSGLYLPPGVNEKEKIQAGFVLRAGPGYPIPLPVDDEPWKESSESVRYIPLQVKEGDYILFLRRETYDIEYEDEKLVIIPQSAVLLIVRDDLLKNI